MDLNIDTYFPSLNKISADQKQTFFEIFSSNFHIINQYNEIKGKHVVTKNDIKPGDILFVEEPYCAVRNDDLNDSMQYCSNCLIYSETSIPCKYCVIHFYCSEYCRQIAWDREHKWICYGERNFLLSDAMRLVLNIVFKACINNFDTTIKDELVYGNTYNNFPFVYSLVTNKNKMSNHEISAFTKLAVWLVIYLKECTNFFDYLYALPANSNKNLSDLYELIGGQILQICMQVHCNSDDIIDASIKVPEQELTKNNIGFGLYVSSSMINHSCEPNTKSTFEQKLKVVRAIRKIPKDTEITIDYLSSNTEKWPPKDFFRNKYKFTCTCTKCTYPLKNERKPWLCNKCQRKAFNITAIHAKCENCNVIFNISNYKQIENSLKPLFEYSTLPVIEKNYQKMKKIYHNDNLMFASHLNLTYEYYLDKANIEKIIEVSKELVQLCDKFNEIDEIKLHSYLKLLRSTGMKCFFKQLQLLIYEGNPYPEFEEAKEKGLNLLKLFISSKRIIEYKKYIDDFLDNNQRY